MSHSDDQAQQELQAWLAANRTTLDNALGDVLDLNAGFADARLPGRLVAFTHALDDVLDLDAGLDQILATHCTSPLPDSTPQPDKPARLTALAICADNLAMLPLSERLTARIWLPRQELADLRSIARRTCTVDHTVSGDLGLALVRALAHTLTNALNLARDHADTVDHGGARDRANDLCLELDHALDVARALTGAVNGIRDRSPALNHLLGRSFARDQVRNLARVVNRARDLGLDRNLGRHCDCVVALGRAFDHTNALCLDLDGLLHHAFDPGLAHELVMAIDQIETATTNMVEADLSQLNLTGIPLEGLRWSRRTRWPAGWQEEIQTNSIELAPGLYEIRSGGVNGIRITDVRP
jgi:hypothetical protein